MKPKGIRVIKGKEPLLRQVIFELRYVQGYVYLDRCGKILNRILREHPEWLVGNELNPQGAALYNMRNRCRFTFSSLKLDLTLDYTVAEQPISDGDLQQFVDFVGSLSRVVIDELGLKVYSRMGLRMLYYFPCENKEEAESWVRGLDVYTLSPKLLSAFQATVDAASMAVVLIGPDCRYRLAFNSVETSAQLDMGSEILTVRASALPSGQRKHLVDQLQARRARQVNSGFAAIIDIDAFHEEPESPDPADFARKNTSSLLELVRAGIV